MRGLTSVRGLPSATRPFRPMRSRIRPVPASPSEVTRCGPVGDKFGDRSREPNSLAELLGPQGRTNKT